MKIMPFYIAIFLSLSILTQTLNAAQIKKKPFGKSSFVNMKMHYREIVSGEKTEFKVGHNNYCTADNLTVDRYESEKLLTSNESGKKTPVRILNIHVRLFSPCSNQPNRKTSVIEVAGEVESELGARREEGELVDEGPLPALAHALGG